VLAAVERRIGELVRGAMDQGRGPFAGACALAEAFLGSWLRPDQLPPGPPLAVDAAETARGRPPSPPAG
jgi:glutamate dehydrogenase (NAD(P)+)